jgi:hypothetical protein
MTFDTWSFIFGTLSGVGLAFIIASIGVKIEEKKEPKYEKSWTDRKGYTTYVVGMGHSFIRVSRVVFSFRGSSRSEDSWTVKECADDANWSVEKMLEYLGLPDQEVLKESGMTMGEWMHERGNQ